MDGDGTVVTSLGTSDLRFSVIIATYNRPAALRACLASLARLDYPRDRFEVIVVDDGGVTDVASAVQEYGCELQLTTLLQAHGGPGPARNLGAAHARGLHLAFIADDCTATPAWLAELDEACSADPDAAIGGSIVNALPHQLCSTASQLLVDYLCAHSNADPARARFFTPSNLAVPARGFAAVGGFDPSFVEAYGEDRDFCDRWISHPFPMRVAPVAVVRHTHPLTLTGFWRQHVNYGRGSYRYHRARAVRRPDTGRFEHPAFYVGLLGYPRLRSRGWRALALTGLLILPQVATGVGFAVQRAKSGSRRNEATAQGRGHIHARG